MFEGAKYESKQETKSVVRLISAEGSDLGALLVNFLSEVLYLSETNSQVYHNIRFKKITDKSIEAVLIGRALKSIGNQIKGVTYHNLDIYQKKDGNWEAIILFDI